MKPSPPTSTWSLLPLLTAALFATATQSSAAVYEVSNLGTGIFGYLPVHYTTSTGDIRANSFTTGTSATQLDSVTLDMFAAPTPTPSGNFSVSIYSYSASGPSTLLASLTGEENPANEQQYTYNAGTLLTLAANTTYFVVARVPQTSPNKSYAWTEASDGTETGASGWSIGDKSWYSSNAGSSWVQLIASPARFSVQASDISAVPEPGVMLPLPVLLASGLMLRLRRR